MIQTLQSTAGTYLDENAAAGRRFSVAVMQLLEGTTAGFAPRPTKPATARDAEWCTWLARATAKSGIETKAGSMQQVLSLVLVMLDREDNAISLLRCLRCPVLREFYAVL